MPKVRWYRPDKNSTPIVQVDEGGGWIPYTASRLNVADNEFSKGFATFQQALKSGYINEVLFENFS